MKVAYLGLRDLLRDNPIAFYELVMLARNPDHELFGNTEEHLTAFLDGPGNIQTTCKRIILAATYGEGLDLSLRPISDLIG
ncbi:hypothetical protein BKG82_27270 [Mycobacteroides chelonae]|uniref:Uncharacterized protein n=1 Tax=Mycobacteroides chelonae TaxID=1774 RepID=A0A1S1LL73_MYCCH|nr:hypothetical protein BKG82_27270 [Mycobacteroides chelonae]